MACRLDLTHEALISSPEVSDMYKAGPGIEGQSGVHATCGAYIKPVLNTGSGANLDWAHRLVPCTGASVQGWSNVGIL